MSRATASATYTPSEEDHFYFKKNRERAKSYYNIDSMQMIRSFQIGRARMIITGVARATRGSLNYPCWFLRMMNKGE